MLGRNIFVFAEGCKATSKVLCLLLKSLKTGLAVDAIIRVRVKVLLALPGWGVIALDGSNCT